MAQGTVKSLVSTLNSKIASMNAISTNQTVAAKTVESGSFVTLATFTPVVAGNYLIEANASFAAGSGNRILLVDVEESSNNTSSNSVLAEGRATLQKVRVFALTPSDSVYIRAYQNSGSSMSVSSNYRSILLK